MKKILQACGLMVLLAAAVRAASNPAMHIRVRVVDDEGKPVAGAPARVRFPAWTEEEVKATDAEGRAEFTFLSWRGPHVDILVGDGYKKVEVSGKTYWPDNGVGYAMNQRPSPPPLNQWTPWGPEVKVVLKPVVRPAPLIADALHAVRFTAGVGGEMPYDFIERDWVTPYGKGKVTDAYIKVIALDEKIPEKHYDYMRMKNLMVTVRFPNEGDGMIKFPHFMGLPVTSPYKNAGSLLWHDARAPDSGYAPVVIFSSLSGEEMTKGVACKESEPEKYGFFAYDDKSAFTRLLPFATWQEAAYLRIRMRQKNSNEKGGIYAVFSYGITPGWMGNAKDGKADCAIYMRYRLNPIAGDRGLEWNGGNLLKIPITESYHKWMSDDP